MPCAGDATSETTMTLGHAAGLEQLFQMCEAADMNGVIPFNRHLPVQLDFADKRVNPIQL